MSPRRWRTAAALACGLLILAGTSPLLGAGGRGASASLKTEDGVVSLVDRAPGEGGIEVVRVTLTLDGERAAPLRVLLAPPAAMAQLGFQVEPGDRLRVNYFVGEGACLVHKVLNASRNTMVRLRTLRQIPLWDNQGGWQGGPGHHGAGEGCPRGGMH
jgi:hypothetical protein